MLPSGDFVTQSTGGVQRPKGCGRPMYSKDRARRNKRGIPLPAQVSTRSIAWLYCLAGCDLCE